MAAGAGAEVEVEAEEEVSRVAGAGEEVLRRAGHMPAFVAFVDGLREMGAGSFFTGAFTGVADPAYSSFL